MKSRLSLTKHNAADKGDLLDQKWMTYFLAAVFVLLCLALVVLLTPGYKQFVVDTVKSVFYGGEQSAPRPKAAPVKFQRSLLDTILIR